MKFYIELANLQVAFRLQKDGSWKSSLGTKLSKDDFSTTDYYQIIRMQEFDKKIKIDGKDWTINPDTSTFGDFTELYYKVYVYRDFLPTIPSKEQLVSVIKNGDDRVSNSLILNVFGFFELRDFFTMNISIDDPTIVMRNETYQAGNEYVGEKPSKDAKYIEDIYASSLEHWLKHLKTGITCQYCDVHAERSSEEVLSDLKALKS